MRRTFAVLAASVLTFSLAALLPADASTTPSVGKPTDYIGAALPQNTRVIVIEGPDWAWGIRPVARHFDEQLPSLRFHVRRGLTATDYPNALHVVVTRRDFGDAINVGEAVTPGQGVREGGFWRFYDEPRGVNLNTDINRRPFYVGLEPDLLLQAKRWVAAHELGHVLGLKHHEWPGIMGGRTVFDTDLSDDEAAAIETTLHSGHGGNPGPVVPGTTS